MKRKTSLFLGDRYKNAGEVIRVGMRLLEEEERVHVLKKVIQSGIDSGIVGNFDPGKHLQVLKTTKRNRSCENSACDNGSEK